MGVARTELKRHRPARARKRRLLITQRSRLGSVQVGQTVASVGHSTPFGEQVSDGRITAATCQDEARISHPRPSRAMRKTSSIGSFTSIRFAVAYLYDGFLNISCL